MTNTNESWIDELMPCMSCGVDADPADGFGTCTCGNEAKREAILQRLQAAELRGEYRATKQAHEDVSLILTEQHVTNLRLKLTDRIASLQAQLGEGGD